MPRIERSATISWEGNVARGVGTINGDTGAFSLAIGLGLLLILRFWKLL